MALQSWPADVPYRPSRESYAVSQRFAPPTATEMEDGPERLRSSNTAVWSKLAYQISMPNAQFEVLDRFVVQDLARGTARFSMPVGRPNTPDPWPPKVVYIEKGTWQVKPDGVDRMLVSFLLNVLDW